MIGQSRASKRIAKLKCLDLEITASPSKWTVYEEGKLKIKKKERVSWTTLIPVNLSAEEECVVLVVNKFLAKERKASIKRFWLSMDFLSSQILSLEQRSLQDESDHSMDDELSDFSTPEEEVKALDQNVIMEETTRSVRFAAEHGTQFTPAPKSSNIDINQAQSNATHHSVINPKSILSVVYSSDSEGSTCTLDDETFDKLELCTHQMRTNFLAEILESMEEVTLVEAFETFYTVTVPNGPHYFTSINDGRYMFYQTGGPTGGAEIFGVEDKRRSRPNTEGWRHRLNRQVAGEMIATAWQRLIAVREPLAADNLYKQQPDLSPFTTPEAENVFYLVFLHRRVHLVSARISTRYVSHVRRGWLSEDDELVLNWTRGFQLHQAGDRAEAIRMIMSMLFYLQELWKTGKHFWRPFELEGELISI